MFPYRKHIFLGEIFQFHLHFILFLWDLTLSCYMTWGWLHILTVPYSTFRFLFRSLLFRPVFLKVVLDESDDMEKYFESNGWQRYIFFLFRATFGNCLVRFLLLRQITRNSVFIRIFFISNLFSKIWYTNWNKIYSWQKFSNT